MTSRLISKLDRVYIYLFHPAGVIRAKKIQKIGMFSSDTAQLFFEDVRVPQKYLIGDEGMGFTYQMLQFQEERLFAAFSSKSFWTELNW